jgi:DNA excision repair protein ERCC-6
MGGVDRDDENIDKYRASIRGEKWYSSPLLFCFELALQNAWQLHKTYDEKLMDFLEFRRRVVCNYLVTHGHPPGPGRRGRNSQKRNIGSRYDGMNHVLVKQGKQTRYAECHKNTTFRCEKCDVALHVKCSVEYHTEYQVSPPPEIRNMFLYIMYNAAVVFLSVPFLERHITQQ